MGIRGNKWMEWKIIKQEGEFTLKNFFRWLEVAILILVVIEYVLSYTTFNFTNFVLLFIFMELIKILGVLEYRLKE